MEEAQKTLASYVEMRSEVIERMNHQMEETGNQIREIAKEMEDQTRAVDKVVTISRAYEEKTNQMCDILEELLSEQTVEAYLADGAVMAVTVAGSDEENTNQILENVETCTAGHSNISCHSGDIEEMHEAHSEGLSLGKYRAYLELKALDPTFTPDDIWDLSMREIRDLIDALSSTDTDENNTGNSAGNGTGNGGSGLKENGTSAGSKGHGHRHGADGH